MMILSLQLTYVFVTIFYDKINFGSDRMIFKPGLYELKTQIELLREEMISTALAEGLNSEQTIMLSQKLDDYITTYISMEYQDGNGCNRS